MGCTLITLPAAFVLTVLLHPLWSWLEAATGLESMGREGPAEWCYLAVWGLLAVATVVPLWLRIVRSARGADALDKRH